MADVIPTRREILYKIIRKLISPRDLKRFMGFKAITGDEYLYFDLMDIFPWTHRVLNLLPGKRLDIDSPIFLAGLRRSGTTVFYRVMNANKHLFMFNERFPGDRLNGRSVASHMNLLYSPQYSEPNVFNKCAKNYFSPRIRSRVDRWGAKLALELAHPDPGSISIDAMKRILAGFPGSKVIAITRDPRDFVLSALKRGGHDVDWWIDEYLSMMNLFSDLMKTHEELILHVKYEDLIDKPEITVKKCCEFVNIPFDSEMLDPSKWSVKGPREYESKAISAKLGKWHNAEGEELDYIRKTTDACFPMATKFGYKVD